MSGPSLAQMDSVADKWKLFEAMVLPPGCPQLQRGEMRKAFYAGFGCLLSTLLHMANNDASESESSEYLASIQNEVVDYANSLNPGNDQTPFHWH